MTRYQMHINLNLLYSVYFILISCRTHLATTIVVSTGLKVPENSTNYTSNIDFVNFQDYSTNQVNTNCSGSSCDLPAINLVLENDKFSHYSDIQDMQLHNHSYNVTNSSISNQTPQNSLVSDDLITSDSSLLTKAISPKMDNDDNLVDVGDTSDSDDDQYNSVEGASSNLSEKRAVKELTKILSRGLAGVTDHVGLEKLENWKQQQKYRKKVKDDRARLFEDILMAAIESHPDKSERFRTKRTRFRPIDDLTQNRSIPILGSYMNNLDPELAQDAETIVQNLQGIASVIGGSNINELTPRIRDDREESDIEKVTTSRPIIRQFNKIKKQLSNRRKQLDQIKKIFNQDYTTTHSASTTFPQNSLGKQYKDPNYREEDEYSIMDDYSNQRPLSRRPVALSNRNYKLEQLSNYLLENPAALGSALAELSSSSVKQSTRELPYISPHLQSDTRTFSRRYRESVAPEEPQDSDSVTRKPSRQDSSTNVGVRDVSSEVDKTRQTVREEVSTASPSTVSLQSSPKSVMSTAETLLLNSLKERQLINLMRLESVLAERQQESAINRNVMVGAPTNTPNIAMRGPPQPLSNANKLSNSTYHHNGRVQESIRNQKQSNKEEHHFMVVNPEPSSTKPEDYGNDLNSLNIDPYDAAALDQARASPKLNRFKDWTDVSQSETRSSIVKDEEGGIGHRNGMVETKKIDTASFSAINKKPSVKRALDSQSKELSRRPDSEAIEEIGRSLDDDQRMTEERDKEANIDEDSGRMMNGIEDGPYDDEGVYVKLDRIALGSEMRSGPVDYFSAYKNEMRSSSTKRPSRVRRKKEKIDNDGDEEGGAAMWAR